MFSIMTNHYSRPSRDEIFFTSHVPTQLMAGLALPSLLVISFLLYISAPAFYYAFPIFYILFIPLLWYSYTYRKSNWPLNDPDIQSIVSRAETKLGMSGRIKLYHSEKTGRLLTSAHTPFLCGILLSDKSARLIKEQPAEGEIVLAHELALLKRDHLWLTFLRNVAAIFYAILTEGLILFDVIEPLLPVLGQVPLWIIAVILCYPLGFGIFIWYRRKAAAETEVESIYGMNPHFAIFHIFSRKSMSDAGRQHYIDSINSNIDSRNSRTIFVSLGVTLVASLGISSLVYFIFIAILMPFEFALFAAVLLGGFTFSFGVYLFESKGTGALKQPEYSTTEWPRGTDEVSVEVEKLLSMRLGRTDCRVLHYPPELLDDSEDEEFDFREILIADKRIIMSPDEWDGLSASELIASYLLGGFTEKKVEIRTRTYSLVLLAVLILLVSGTVYLAFIQMAQLPFFFIWIFSCGAIAFLLLLALISESSHRKTKALRIFAKQDENYIFALKKLAESENASKYIQVDAKRKLAKVTSESK